MPTAAVTALSHALPSLSQAVAKYALSSYDDYLCLKPPLLLWVAVTYLSRAVLVPLVVGLGRATRTSADSLQLLWGLWSPQGLIPSLLAALVLVALCRRHPGAATPVRWIWSHGRALLSISAVWDGSVAMLSLLRVGQIDSGTLPSLMALAFDGYCVLYVLAARRVRDTFADFPAAAASR